MARNEIPKAGEFYKHFKNKLYQIVAVAEHTETGEKLVIYQALYGDFSIYARPLSMFMSEVDRQKYPDVTQKYRFVKVKFVTKTEGTVSNKDNTKIGELDVDKEDVQKTKEEFRNENGIKAEIEKKLEISNSIENTLVKTDVEKEAEARYKRPLKKQYSAEELFYQFLNADTYKEKLEIFLDMKDKTDDRILTNIAVSMDIVVEDDDLEERYTMIRQNLETYAKFECNRLR